MTFVVDIFCTTLANHAGVGSKSSLPWIMFLVQPTPIRGQTSVISFNIPRTSQKQHQQAVYPETGIQTLKWYTFYDIVQFSETTTPLHNPTTLMNVDVYPIPCMWIHPTTSRRIYAWPKCFVLHSHDGTHVNRHRWSDGGGYYYQQLQQSKVGYSCYRFFDLILILQHQNITTTSHRQQLSSSKHQTRHIQVQPPIVQFYHQLLSCIELYSCCIYCSNPILSIKTQFCINCDPENGAKPDFPHQIDLFTIVNSNVLRTVGTEGSHKKKLLFGLVQEKGDFGPLLDLISIQSFLRW